MESSSQPVLPKTPFIVGNALLAGLAVLLVLMQGYPVSSAVAALSTFLLLGGCALGIVPYVVDYQRALRAAADAERANAQQTAVKLGQLSREIETVAGGVRNAAEEVRNAARQSEQLPAKMQAAVTDLERRIANVNSENSERFAMVADQLQRAVQLFSAGESALVGAAKTGEVLSQEIQTMAVALARAEFERRQNENNPPPPPPAPIVEVKVPTAEEIAAPVQRALGTQLAELRARIESRSFAEEQSRLEVRQTSEAVAAAETALARIERAVSTLAVSRPTEVRETPAAAPVVAVPTAEEIAAPVSSALSIGLGALESRVDAAVALIQAQSAALDAKIAELRAAAATPPPPLTVAVPTATEIAAPVQRALATQLTELKARIDARAFAEEQSRLEVRQTSEAMAGAEAAIVRVERALAKLAEEQAAQASKLQALAAAQDAVRSSVSEALATANARPAQPERADEPPPPAQPLLAPAEPAVTTKPEAAAGSRRKRLPFSGMLAGSLLQPQTPAVERIIAAGRAPAVPTTSEGGPSSTAESARVTETDSTAQTLAGSTGETSTSASARQDSAVSGSSETVTTTEPELGLDLGDVPVRAPATKFKPAPGSAVLVARAYIGIGNKLYVRGEGAGLSRDKGQPMVFLEIGKWGWVCPNPGEDALCVIYKNDEVPASEGEVYISGGQTVEVTPSFGERA